MEFEFLVPSSPISTFLGFSCNFSSLASSSTCAPYTLIILITLIEKVPRITFIGTPYTPNTLHPTLYTLNFNPATP